MATHTRAGACFAASAGPPGDAQQPEDGGNVVSVALEGAFGDARLEAELPAQVEADAGALLRCVQARNGSDEMELSLVLCDDAHIADLNRDFRSTDGPTDVLSFELESPPGYPLQLLGDIVISVETARMQAEERGHALRDELRVLLVHGLLHLFGHDHERGPADAREMAGLEAQLLAALGWQGKGLIAAAELPEEADLHAGDRLEPAASISGSAAAAEPGTQRRQRREPQVRLLALDLDGTLLDSSSRVLPSSVAAVKAALASRVRVCLATGKARPAAVAAMARVGLAGDGLVISSRGPGLFLQGLAVHGGDGTLLEGPSLPPRVVRAAFEYAQELQVPLAAFLGDTCATLQMHPELEELHRRYYEPLCEVRPSMEALLTGPPVKKLLLMTDADAIAQTHLPHWTAAARSMGADTTQAVPDMLEILPAGVDKWVGMRLLLADLGLTREQVACCGDGANDLQLVANCGLGIAMGNAVPEVKAVAAHVVASNDDGGIQEAVERFVL